MKTLLGMVVGYLLVATVTAPARNKKTKEVLLEDNL